MDLRDLALTVLIFAAALLYSTVGHAGASGYLAVMALLGLSPEIMKPTALVLNVLVASLASIRFCRAGSFRWQLFWPFAVTSVPLAAVGGGIALPGVYYKPIVGVVLIYAAVRLAKAGREAPEQVTSPPPRHLALLVGAGLGFLSGLTGVGGGIFLSPLLLFAGWATPRETAGVSSVFILVNSVAGLIGHASSLAHVPRATWYWGPAAVSGGWIGAGLGSRHLPNRAIRRLLAAVVFLAGLKMVLIP